MQANFTRLDILAFVPYPTNMIIASKYRICSNLIIVFAKDPSSRCFREANSIPSEAKFSKCFLLTLLRLFPNIDTKLDYVKIHLRHHSQNSWHRFPPDTFTLYILRRLNTKLNHLICTKHILLLPSQRLATQLSNNHSVTNANTPTFSSTTNILDLNKSESVLFWSWDLISYRWEFLSTEVNVAS